MYELNIVLIHIYGGPPSFIKASAFQDVCKFFTRLKKLQ